MIKTILIFAVLVASNVSFGYNEFIPATSQVTVVPEIITPPIVEVPLVPSATYSNFSRPLFLMYDWVPYNINKTVVVERQGLFGKYRIITYQPVIQWVYQPVWR